MVLVPVRVITPFRTKVLMYIHMITAGGLLGGPAGMIAGAGLGGLLNSYGSRNSMSLE